MSSRLVFELLELFEVLIHSILYQRGIYPMELFECSKKYGIVIHKSRHPQLNLFIAQALKQGIYHFLKNQTLKQLIIVIKNIQTNEILEKFVFDISFLGKSLAVNYNCTNDEIIELQKHFRSLIIKIYAMNTQLNENAADFPSKSQFDSNGKHFEIEKTWAMQIRTSKFDFNEEQHSQWIFTNKENNKNENHSNSNKSEIQNKYEFQIIPVSNFKIKLLSLNVMIFEKTT